MNTKFRYIVPLCLLILISPLLIGMQTPSYSYKIIDLGTLGGSYACALDINDRGQVVGFSTTSGDMATHAFLWQDGTMIDLGTLGGYDSQAKSINNRGQIVGYSVVSDGSSHAFLWEKGTMIDLGTFDGIESWAVDINDAGEILGAFALPDYTGYVTFIWKNGSVTSLDEIYQPMGINNRGQVTGSYASPDGYSHAVLWDKGQITDLGVLGGFNSIGFDINDAGEIVGQSNVDEDWTTHGFLWQDGEMIDLGAAPGSGGSEARGINNLGEIVGFDYFDDYVAFLWVNGTRYQLPTLGGSFNSAWKINDTGTIVGNSSTIDDLEFHAVVWGR